MNALLPLFTTAVVAVDQKAANLLAAARALTPHLNRSRALDRKLVSGVMTTSFGASDAEGAWLWRDAYDAVEAALVLQLRRLAPQIGRLEDAPADIAALLANLSGLCLTHTRRSEEQVAMDQFSTPPELGCLAVLAAQVRPGDRVLEPSAGTGLLAILAEACGAALTLNEWAAGREALLDALFPLAVRSQHDAVHLADVLNTSGAFHVALVNPPFQQLEAHLRAALACLADGGRLAAIVPTRLFDDAEALRALSAHGRVVLRLAFPARAYAKHGTSVETGLLVIDRGLADAAMPTVIAAETLADAAKAAAAVAARPTAQTRQFLSLDTVALLVPKARALATPSGRLAFLANTAVVAYETCPWSGEGHDVGLYQAYSLGRVRFAANAPHPSPLVESGPMASVAPPAPTYRPVLPPDIASRAGCRIGGQAELLGRRATFRFAVSHGDAAMERAVAERARRPPLAAQYIRMSTDRQEYSAGSQRDAIAAFAQARGYEIVKTYCDLGISGLHLKKRHGLQALLADAVGGEPGYSIILVYDVSRWGRFQDTDQGAHYEFLCREAGLRVEYCAELFDNDGSLAAMILKSVRRAMAAEFSRDLGVKVLACQLRAARMGFKQGARAPYGMRRVLVDANRATVRVLEVGELKAIRTQRVLLIPGPEVEVAVVRRVFQQFVVEGLSRTTIAELLNEEGIPAPRGGVWSASALTKLMLNETYAGILHWNQRTQRLGGRRTENPKSEWVRVPDAYPAIVSQKVYDAAWRKITRYYRHLSDAELIDRLRALLALHGRLSDDMVNAAGDGVPCANTYRYRFGTITRAFEMAGYVAKRPLGGAVARRVQAMRARQAWDAAAGQDE